VHRIDTSNVVAKRGFTAMCRPGAHIGRLALGAAQRGLRCRTAAETPPIAQPVWRPRMRAQIVAYQQLRDIEAGRAVGLALGGVMVAARRDTVG